MTRKKPTARELIEDTVDEIMLADGFDDAILGIAQRCGQPVVAVYDAQKCIEILMSRDGMGWEEAREYYEFNVVGAWVGPGTPVFLERLNDLADFGEDETWQ